MPDLFEQSAPRKHISADRPQNSQTTRGQKERPAWLRRANSAMEVLRLPRVDVTLWGGAPAEKIYRSFTRRHPRLFVVRNKCWGVALLKLPDTFASYLAGGKKQTLRTNRKRAIQSGLSFTSFTPLSRIEDILEINNSSGTRQGRSMDKEYVNAHDLSAFLATIPQMYGVLDGTGRLRAYAYTPVIGEVFLISRILGHADFLADGIVYLLISEVIREMTELKASKGTLKWGMYDTFYGGGDGLRYFKARMGFEPHNVTWHWRNERETV